MSACLYAFFSFHIDPSRFQRRALRIHFASPWGSAFPGIHGDHAGPWKWVLVRLRSVHRPTPPPPRLPASNRSGLDLWKMNARL